LELWVPLKCTPSGNKNLAMVMLAAIKVARLVGKISEKKKLSAEKY